MLEKVFNSAAQDFQLWMRHMVFNKINFNPIKPIVWLCNLPWLHNYQLSKQLIYYMSYVSKW